MSFGSAIRVVDVVDTNITRAHTNSFYTMPLGTISWRNVSLKIMILLRLRRISHVVLSPSLSISESKLEFLSLTFAFFLLRFFVSVGLRGMIAVLSEAPSKASRYPWRHPLQRLLHP